LNDYNEQTTEELLDLLITLSKVHQGLYNFELKGYVERLNQIKEVVLSRVTS
jgi:hypothetical protein